MMIEELLFKLGIQVDTGKLQEFAGALAHVENSNVEAVMDGVSSASVGAAAAMDEAANAAARIADEVKKVGDEANKAGDAGEKAANKTGGAFNRAKGNVISFKRNLTLIIGAAMAVSVGVAHGINNIISRVDEYAKSKNQLYLITKDEIKQSKEFTRGFERSGQLLESLKVRVSLGLLPVLSSLATMFNELLINNKALISEGLTAFFKTIVSIVKIVLSFVGAIDRVINNTIGWKAALLALVAILAIVKAATIAAFAANPLTWIILGIVAVIAIIDDLIVYLKGGESAFGAFWGPAIEWAKKAWKWFGDTMNAIAGFFEDAANGMNAWIDKVADIFSRVIDIITYPFKIAFAFVEKLFDATIGKIADGIKSVAGMLRLTGESGSSSGSPNAASAAVGAQTNNSQTVNRGGDVKAEITVVSPDPAQAGNKVRDSLSPSYARANQNLQGSRAY